MASEIMTNIERLSREKEELESREAEHRAGAEDQRRLHNVEHALEVLWDLRRREMSGEEVSLDDDFYDRYNVSPGDDAPESAGG